MTISDPIYGDIEIAEPVLLELIDTPAMQRIRGVDQNVTARIVDIPWGHFSRFDHCVGVMHIIKRLGGNLEEQIAGLLHDVSHTAFSHVMDFVFGSVLEQDFHEKHLERVVMQSTIPAILEKHGFETKRIINHHNYPLLEQDIPGLCADRVDYALKTFYSNRMASLPQVLSLLENLQNFDHRIVFQDEKPAHEFASLFLQADQNAWGGSTIANAAYYYFARIVKQAQEKGVITLDDFFTTDQEFSDKLDAGSRAKIAALKKIKVQEVPADEDHDFFVKTKIRYVDPQILTKNGVIKLSEQNPAFKAELEQFLAKRKQGNYVKILK